VLQDRDKIVFHKTTPDLQDQCARPRLRPIFWSQTGVVLRPTVSDHITGPHQHATGHFFGDRTAMCM